MIEKKDDTAIENILKDAIEDAIDFVESEIAPDRIKAQRYFDGEVDIGHEEGRSSVVCTKVRDTVRNIKPSLLRIFLSSDKPAEYVPKRPDQVASCDQATSYVTTRFSEMGGYTILNDAFHDALVKKQGVVKAYWDKYSVGEIYTYSNLTDEEFYMIMAEDGVEMVEHSEEIVMEVDPETGIDVERKSHEVKISKSREEGKLCGKSLPPEEFFVDRNATSLADSYICGHRTEMRIGDLVEMGFDIDELLELDTITDGSTAGDAESFERKGYSEDQESGSEDEAMRLVAVTEAYMKMDIEGTGIPMLYKFLCGGSNYKVLDYELWDDIPFAVFEIDPEPHAFYGRSIADLLIDDQDATSSILRGILDNVALTNNPRMEVLDDMVNMDDVLNNEIGAIVRSRQIGSVQPLAVPFVAGSTLPALQYLDMMTETKSGVSRSSLGLDPDSLQNTSATAAKLAAQGGQGQIEVIARNLGEGYKQLFKLMLKLIVKNSPEEAMMRLSGQFIPVNPRAWDIESDVSVNVGLGSGQEDVKLASLQNALQLQMQIYSQYGAQNGLVGITQIRNTLADILSLGGYSNAERYFNPMNPQMEQQIVQAMQQQAAQQEGQGDPNAAYLQAEQIKAQTRLQSDMAKIQANQQSDAAKIQSQQQAKMTELQFRRQADVEKLQMQFEESRKGDDFNRDKMAQDMVLKAGEILAKYGTAVDLERIRLEQNAPRDNMGNI